MNCQRRTFYGRSPGRAPRGRRAVPLQSPVLARISHHGGEGRGFSPALPVPQASRLGLARSPGLGAIGQRRVHKRQRAARFILTGREGSRYKSYIYAFNA